MPLVQREVTEWEPSGMPTVIAFDPGGTTGWSAFTVHPDALCDPDVSILENIIHWDQGQIEGDEVSQADCIIEMLDMFDGAAVLFEDFELHNLAAELSPVRLTAVATWACQRLFEPARTIYLQMPSMMTTASDDRLRRWGLYRRDNQPHARDATRHAIVFLRRAKNNLGIRKAAWPHAYG